MLHTGAQTGNLGPSEGLIETDAIPPKERHMRTGLVAILLLGGVLVTCLPVSAHHGNAAYSDKATEFKNVTVTKFAWANPHCLVEFNVKDANGKVVNWTAETGSPEALRLAGWSKASLRPGDVITIYVHTAKTGQPAGRLTKVVLADGTVLGDTQRGTGGTGPASGYKDQQ
jgi:hypothetical protein